MPKLAVNPIHLGLGATAVSEPPFTGMEWYDAYGARHEADGHEGRLVSVFTFSEPWDMWRQARADQAHSRRVREQRAGRLAHRRCRSRGHGSVHHRRRRHATPAALLTAVTKHR